jgi:two-component system, cell cycle sensor histidine kinase and response regulator CckA
VGQKDLVGGRETVLLVEDREEVRRALREYLTHLGYGVIVASESADALALLKETDVDVLLTDVQMPGGLGTDLAAAVRELRPGVRVVLMSGYAPDPAMRQRMGLLDAAFLQKPFAANELVQILRAPRVQ